MSAVYPSKREGVEAGCVFLMFSLLLLLVVISSSGYLSYTRGKVLMDYRLKLASTIAEKSPVATMGTKKLINYSRDHSVEDGKRYRSDHSWSQSLSRL